MSASLLAELIVAIALAVIGYFVKPAIVRYIEG